MWFLNSKLCPEKEADPLSQDIYGSHYVVLKLKNSLFLCQDLFAVAQDQPFRFPSTFTFVIRAFSTLEGTYSISSIFFLLKSSTSLTIHAFDFSGIGYILDPDFSFVKVAAPYAQVLTSFLCSKPKKLAIASLLFCMLMIIDKNRNYWI